MIEITKGKKLLLREHPLLKEDLDSWVNIPICIKLSINNLIKNFIEGEE